MLTTILIILIFNLFMTIGLLFVLSLMETDKQIYKVSQNELLIYGILIPGWSLCGLILCFGFMMIYLILKEIK